MFQFFRSPSRSAAGAILYVTTGTLIIIWSGLWYYYFLMPLPSPPAWQSYVCVGMILSGIAIAAIGLLFGMIGRGAKAADNTVGGVGTTPITAAPVIQTPVASTRIGSARIVEAPGIGTPVEAMRVTSVG